MQIKALSKLYQILVSFQNQTILIRKSDDVSPEIYTTLVQNWMKVYCDCLSEFSNEKYILPKELKNLYEDILPDFKKLLIFINCKDQKNNLIYTNEIGEIELGGDNDDLTKISFKIKELDGIKIMSNSIKKIIQLREQIERFFNE